MVYCLILTLLISSLLVGRPIEAENINEDKIVENLNKIIVNEGETPFPLGDFVVELASPIRTPIQEIVFNESLIAEMSYPTPEVVNEPYTAPVVSTTLSKWLLDLRNCESGGNYQTNTGNGYYGAYQFSIATWNHWNTGYARADLAPASVQDATIILNTNMSAGLTTQNPGCYSKMGLSNKPPKE